jgi:hypothetical protein
MESPEHWFEDFGSARLQSGRAIVNLDADFAKVIKRGDYRVFVTPEGDCGGLYLRRKSATSFEVRELTGHSHVDLGEAPVSPDVLAPSDDAVGKRDARLAAANGAGKFAQGCGTGGENSGRLLAVEKGNAAAQTEGRSEKRTERRTVTRVAEGSEA